MAVRYRYFAAAGGGYDDLGALGLDGGADGVAVVASIGDQLGKAAARRLDQRRCHDHVAGVAGRNQEDAWSAVLVGQPVDLAGAAATRSAEALREGPPFAPAAERCALMLVESIATEPHTPECPVSASNTANHTPCRLQR